MNKKQKSILILWALLLIILGVSWIGYGKKHCDFYGIDQRSISSADSPFPETDVYRCEGYSWDLISLISGYLIISAPATILVFLFKSNK